MADSGAPRKQPLKEKGMSPLSVAVVFGTRPEAIKLAPVVRELRRRHEVRTRVIVTAQHRELLDQVLEDCQLRVDEDLNLMQADQTPSALAARALAGLERSLARLEADWVIIQGDTTTTVAGALAAYWGRRRVCHVEEPPTRRPDRRPALRPDGPRPLVFARGRRRFGSHRRHR
jgi:UDP-N-acetylglucosamine 2-epimerase